MRCTRRLAPHIRPFRIRSSSWPKQTAVADATLAWQVLPALPPAKTRKFPLKNFVDTGEAGLPTQLLLCNRHFVLLQDVSKPTVVAVTYYEGTDRIESVVRPSPRGSYQPTVLPPSRLPKPGCHVACGRPTQIPAPSPPRRSCTAPPTSGPSTPPPR